MDGTLTINAVGTIVEHTGWLKMQIRQINTSKIDCTRTRVIHSDGVGEHMGAHMHFSSCVPIISWSIHLACTL
jgi:hypothetical protein